MKMTGGKRMPKVETDKPETLVAAAKAYKTVMEEIDKKIAYGLKVKDISEKNAVFREIRMML